MRGITPIHPGEQLREEFMRPRAITCERLAQDIGVESRAVADIVAERRPISSEMALRLGRYFGTSARFWLDMQRDFDLERTAAALGNRLDAEVKAMADPSPYGGPDRRARPRLG